MACALRRYGVTDSGILLRPQTRLALLDDPLHHSQRKTRSNLGAISFNVVGRR
ncbi:MAG: hypothetical protein P8X89_21285 [Reinekea sp.]